MIMLLSRGRLYQREAPSRDARLFIIYCEGDVRELQYFEYFEEISSKIKLEINPPIEHRTSPLDLYNQAVSHIIKSDENINPKYEEDDEVWFAIDTDNWGVEISQLRKYCINQINWNVAQSNPCFEVWLYYHQFQAFEDFENMHTATAWKAYLHTKIAGGFNSKKHPIFIEKAIENSKLNFKEEITVGSTEVFKLAESFYPFVKNNIEEALEANAIKKGIRVIDFAKYSSIKVGQPTEVLMLKIHDEIPKDRYLIGGANNLLVSPTPSALMMLSKDFATITEEDNILTIGASMPTGRIVSYMRKHDIAGFEFCAKLPGTLGGILAMNAGVKSYEIFNILHSIEINGEWILKEDILHGYRFASLGGVATHAKFKIIKGFSQDLLDELVNLRSNQPHEPSAGSAFKNPEGDYAGRLIEAVGLKGFRKGDMAWSEVHSNFLVNLGQGTYEDAKYLIDLAKEKVYEAFKIRLQEEIKIL